MSGKYQQESDRAFTPYKDQHSTDSHTILKSIVSSTVGALLAQVHFYHILSYCNSHFKDSHDV